MIDHQEADKQQVRKLREGRRKRALADLLRAETQFLMAYGWKLHDGEWQAPKGHDQDTVSQSVAVATQKNWNARGYVPGG
jgi:hypothetical protein